ncbi:MAG: hypothetical protein N4A36_01320 [Candidatus Gracilibacteria bacterium]|jgi:hypothetical protein|nr:hypothetical protein [Candidatus Gracilibacteria bacterium]
MSVETKYIAIAENPPNNMLVYTHHTYFDGLEKPIPNIPGLVHPRFIPANEIGLTWYIAETGEKLSMSDQLANMSIVLVSDIIGRKVSRIIEGLRITYKL